MELRDEIISRQAAYDTLAEYYHLRTETQRESLKEALSRVTTIEPKRGKWLLHEYPDGYYHTECSECGKVYSENVYFLRKPNYCPNCGAKMERSEE